MTIARWRLWKWWWYWWRWNPGMGRDQQRVEGVGEDETVKRQTRRGGGGCRRCYGLLHINIYDYSDSSMEFSSLFYFLTGSLSISRYFSLTSRVSTNSIFCPILSCHVQGVRVHLNVHQNARRRVITARCSHNHTTSPAAVSTYLLISTHRPEPVFGCESRPISQKSKVEGCQHQAHFSNDSSTFHQFWNVWCLSCRIYAEFYQAHPSFNIIHCVFFGLAFSGMLHRWSPFFTQFMNKCAR